MKINGYYHFTTQHLRDGRDIPPVGKWLEHVGPLVPCESGLHASKEPFDALQFAPGSLLHLVELAGKLKTHGNPVDKVCARKRKIVATIDATELLQAFARRVALDVIHLWDAPNVVLEYLNTGDESLRVAARDAAYAAARVAARDAAHAAARDAAHAAARDAAYAAARAAARAAALDAAHAAARVAARAAVAEAAALAKYRQWFNGMVEEAFSKV